MKSILDSDNVIISIHSVESKFDLYPSVVMVLFSKSIGCLMKTGADSQFPGFFLLNLNRFEKKKLFSNLKLIC